MSLDIVYNMRINFINAIVYVEFHYSSKRSVQSNTIWLFFANNEIIFFVIFVVPITSIFIHFRSEPFFEWDGFSSSLSRVHKYTNYNLYNEIICMLNLYCLYSVSCGFFIFKFGMWSWWFSASRNISSWKI